MGRKAVTEDQKWQFIGAWRMNVPVKQICEEYGVSRHCVREAIRKYEESQQVQDYHRVGRRRITTDRQDSVIRRLSRKSRTAALPDLKAELRRYNIPGSLSTISRRLRESGLDSYAALSKPLLTRVHKKNRSKFCRDRVHWTKEDWHRVVFSDESRFELFPRRKILVRRTSKEKFCTDCVVPRVQQGGGSVMVWGCITSKGPGEFQVIDGTMNSDRYIETMKNYMQPSVHRLLGEDFIFQQDNAPCHTSKKTKQWFESKEIELLEWPARSPDLNPIENLWNWLGMEVAKQKPSTVAELRALLIEMWQKIDQKICLKLIESMPNRMKECKNAKGGPIDY